MFIQLHRLLYLLVFAQMGVLNAQERPIEERLLQKSPEEILQKRNPALAKTILNKQKYLALDKPGKNKRIRFFMGDEIRFKLKQDSRRYRGEIASITDSTFSFVVHNEVTNRFEYQHFKVADVHSVLIIHRIPFVSSATRLSPLAGLGLASLDIINSWGIDKGWHKSGVAKTSAGLIAFGGIGRLLERRNYRIKGYKRLRVLQSF